MELRDATTTAPQDLPHLILNFDINKTIIMIDPVQKKDIANVLNDILADVAFGSVQEGTSQWKWNGKLPRTHCTRLNNKDGKNDQSNKTEISYGDYVRQQYPTDNKNDPEVKRKNKAIRKELRKAFTSEGHPGEGLRDEYNRLEQSLKIPPPPSTKNNIMSKDDAEEGCEYAFIIPSFFRCIMHLEDTNRSFHIIFRTFGQDIPEVAKEWNEFCQGNHPLFPHVRMDGSRDGTVDRRLHLETPTSHGAFHRDEDGTTTLFTGKLQVLETKVDRDNGDESLRGMNKIHTFLKTQAMKSHSTLAFRDYYPYWWAKGESSDAGKIFLIDKSHGGINNGGSDGLRKTHAMFFDDKIGAKEAHIVDARDAKLDFAPIPFERAKNVHLIRVEPYHSLGDADYFINLIAQAERK